MPALNMAVAWGAAEWAEWEWGGWVAVDRGTFETAWPGVFAIGDVTTVPLAMGKPLPKAGVFAHGQAEVVAANIAARWTGSEPNRRFDGHGECFVETGDGGKGAQGLQEGLR